MAISVTVRKMIMVMLVAGMVMAIGGAVLSVFYPVINPFTFSAGVLLTTVLNIVKVVWLERAVEKAVGMEDQTAAGNFIRLQYLLRMLLTGLTLFAAVVIPFVELWGAVVGLFTFHAAKYSLGFIIKEDNTDIS